MAGEVVDKIDKVGIFVDMWDENVGLEEGRDSLIFIAADGDSERVFQTCSLKTFNLRTHSSGEQVCPSLAGNDFEDVIDNLPKIEVKKSISFVHHQVLK